MIFSPWASTFEILGLIHLRLSRSHCIGWYRFLKKSDQLENFIIEKRFWLLLCHLLWFLQSTLPLCFTSYWISTLLVSYAVARTSLYFHRLGQRQLLWTRKTWRTPVSHLTGALASTSCSVFGPDIKRNVSKPVLLFTMPACLQAPRRLHLPSHPSRRVGQEQDGDAGLLRDDVAGEAWQDRWIPGAEDQPGHLSGKERAGRHRHRGHGSGQKDRIVANAINVIQACINKSEKQAYF